MKLQSFLLILILTFFSCSSKSYKDAARNSAGIATPASEQKEDIFQIYTARAFSWRGNFAIHPWVAWKKSDDKSYTIAHVTGWRVQRGLPAVTVREDLPDRLWFDSVPEILDEHKGEKARRIIEHVESLIEKYPHRDTYTLYPGPNSNTFVAYLIRHTPELKIELPANAIGKDYLGQTTFGALSPSGQGVQLSAWGLLGLTLGLNEGIEVNVLGLNFGVDFWTPALKLPFVGRFGFKDRAL
jgi:hypothetical protein